AKYREFGGSFIYPMGPDTVTLGMVVGLDYRDVELSVHDLLQELKTHPQLRGILEGGERIAWGAKTIPEGGLLSVPRRLHAPGLLICGDGAGLVNVPALKGIHYAVESGRLAAETAFSALQRGESPNHIRVRTDGPADVAELWEHLCPAQVYEAVKGGVEVTASNCVQCGAITAKGGRLTPPEGGSGPEYTLT